MGGAGRGVVVAGDLAGQALQAVDLAFRAGGASSIYLASPLERCLRDIRAAAQHHVLTGLAQTLENVADQLRALAAGRFGPGPELTDRTGS